MSNFFHKEKQNLLQVDTVVLKHTYVGYKNMFEK